MLREAGHRAAVVHPPPSAPEKSIPMSRASSDAAGPMWAFAAGYRSRWCTQNRNGSIVAHWNPSGTVCSTGSATGRGYGRRRPSRPRATSANTASAPSHSRPSACSHVATSWAAHVLHSSMRRWKSTTNRIPSAPTDDRSGKGASSSSRASPSRRAPAARRRPELAPPRAQRAGRPFDRSHRRTCRTSTSDSSTGGLGSVRSHAFNAFRPRG